MTKSIRDRIRKLVEERRRFKRLKAARETKLVASVTSGVGVRREHMIGQTRDVSEEGLSILFPVISPKQREVLIPGSRARIALALPAETVMVEVDIVRSAPLVSHDVERGHTIAVAIKRILGEDKGGFKKYVSSLSQ